MKRLNKKSLILKFTDNNKIKISILAKNTNKKEDNHP